MRISVWLSHYLKMSMRFIIWVPTKYKSCQDATHQRSDSLYIFQLKINLFKLCLQFCRYYVILDFRPFMHHVSVCEFVILASIDVLTNASCQLGSFGQRGHSMARVGLICRGVHFNKWVKCAFITLMAVK